MDKTIYDWCEANGWTEPFWVEGQWWAFPPQAVMPLPLPWMHQQSLFGHPELDLAVEQAVMAIDTAVDSLINTVEQVCEPLKPAIDWLEDQLERLF